MSTITRRALRRATAAAALVVLCVAVSAPATAQDVSEETLDTFRANCASCHTIGGGRLAGPDLKDVTKRQKRDWLVRFILDPKGVIDSGDPYAQEMLREARGVYMTQVPGMTRARAEKLIDLIVVESAKEKSRFAGMQISDRPLTAADVARGERLFTGADEFQNGAPHCISCHQVRGIGGFGGGRLGPDLSDAYSRLEGRKALSAWLAAPPSLTMQPVYRDHELEGDEVLALVAYLKKSAEAGQTSPDHGSLEFLLAGIAGVVLVLVAFDLVWRNRFRAVRRPLVKGLSR